ncbi:branched-chain amino acid ABC transporter permease [Arthrobacter sp. MI7-26]|uniref:branched-chain amino acid ABC transporter permease n=1 Tax=Arthrobacter sp. MI7-26 TaxID=2993653 RepID=UPI0022495909|nr:branched-chain amino acid ABC transporter permease [Arthrobacter sp. MI7-26]MCX2749905.1 branched-chain amino acid ABC transporter permease [Arthrobacter sp. MI7-26]
MTSSRTSRLPLVGWRVPHVVLSLWTLIVPLVVIWVVASAVSNLLPAASIDLGYALATLIIVVAMWSFIGNSGVLSFGHLAFVAVGAWTMSLLTINPSVKSSIMPELAPFLAHASANPYAALLIAGVAGGVTALVSGFALMRLHGLEAGIATFALLMLVLQVLTYWSAVGPKSGQSMTGVPRSFDLQSTLVIALIVVVLAWGYGQSRSARMLRASRENAQAAPASGINITWHRIIAFAISGALAGVGGAMWAQTNRVVQASQFGLDFTFTTIAMLVVGGMLSVWGAVVGSLLISALNHVLGLLENGMHIGAVVISLPSGSRLVVVAAFMVIILIFRPAGITGGREVTWPFRPPDPFLRRGPADPGRDEQEMVMFQTDSGRVG